MTTYELPPTPNGVDEDAWRGAIGAIRGYCGWHISPSITETLIVDGPGDSLLLLPTLRLTNLTALTIDGTPVALEDVQWSERGGVRGYRTSTAKWRGVSVEITHGYDEFPADLLAVARSMAAAGDGSIAKRYQSGPHSVDLTDQAIAGAFAIGPLQRNVLDRYRIPGRP